MLKLAENLSLPIDAVTQKFAFLGRTGSGKTYGAMKLAELMLDAKAQIVALDGIGVWYGLRLKADGQGKGFSIPVFGGENGDIPLEPQAGRLIAKLIVEEQFSAILDVSSFRKHERKTFVTDFAEELFHRKKTNRSAIHFFCEESQMFIPERSGKDGARMLGAFEDLIKLGRNYGIGASLISQRPQAVNKEVLNQTECLIAFQMTGIHERKAIAAWISEKGIDGEKLEDLLPSLKVGDARIWSPQWLQISETIHIAKKETYDASSTPKVGAAIVQPKELSPVDVEKIKESMADVVKRADESDPKKLKAEIAKLRRDVEQAQKVIPQAAAKEVIKEVPVIPEKAVDALREEIAGFRKEYIGKLEIIAKGFEALNGQKTLNQIESSVAKLLSGIPQTAPLAPKPIIRPQRPSVQLPPTPPLRPSVVAVEGNLSGLALRILNALAELESFGMNTPDRRQLGFYLGNNVTGGHGANVLGSLRTQGYVEYPQPGLVCLTEAGRSSANSADSPLSLDEFHNRVRRHLSGLHLRIFDALIGHYSNAVSREDLGAEIGSVLTGGHGANILGALRTAGLVVYPQPGFARASDTLFPEGLV